MPVEDTRKKAEKEELGEKILPQDTNEHLKQQQVLAEAMEKKKYEKISKAETVLKGLMEEELQGLEITAEEVRKIYPYLPTEKQERVVRVMELLKKKYLKEEYQELAQQELRKIEEENNKQEEAVRERVALETIGPFDSKNLVEKAVDQKGMGAAEKIKEYAKGQLQRIHSALQDELTIIEIPPRMLEGIRIPKPEEGQIEQEPIGLINAILIQDRWTREVVDEIAKHPVLQKRIAENSEQPTLYAAVKEWTEEPEEAKGYAQAYKELQGAQEREGQGIEELKRVIEWHANQWPRDRKKEEEDKNIALAMIQQAKRQERAAEQKLFTPQGGWVLEGTRPALEWGKYENEKAQITDAERWIISENSQSPLSVEEKIERERPRNDIQAEYTILKNNHMKSLGEFEEEDGVEGEIKRAFLQTANKESLQNFKEAEIAITKIIESDKEALEILVALKKKLEQEPEEQWRQEIIQRLMPIEVTCAQYMSGMTEFYREKNNFHNVIEKEEARPVQTMQYQRLMNAKSQLDRIRFDVAMYLEGELGQWEIEL